MQIILLVWLRPMQEKGVWIKSLSEASHNALYGGPQNVIQALCPNPEALSFTEGSNTQNNSREYIIPFYSGTIPN